MTKALRMVAMLCIVTPFVACSGQSSTLPVLSGQRAQSLSSNALPRKAGSFLEAMMAAVPHQSPFEKTPNVFAQARGLDLNDSDLDAYIDPSVTGPDRATAHRLMGEMPKDQRGDFVYMSKEGRLISNNPARLKNVTVQHGTSPSAQSWDRNSTQALRPMDYSSSCAPPNPPNPPIGGPYVRQVSQCGFLGAWGFVTVPCGTSYFPTGDAGHLYFEIQGRSGTAVEGGLEYYSDSSVAPYMRNTTVPTNHGYVDMTDGTDRFTCGEVLSIEHGVVGNNYDTFTQVTLSNVDPSNLFVTGTIFSPTYGAWLFFPVNSDMIGQNGTDPGGTATSCTGCSISEVTSIAQGSQYWNQDGSYFGVGSNGNAIHWMQVIMGEYQSNCYSGTSLCTFDFSPYPTTYYGGPQYYPDSTVSQSNFSPNPAKAAYETYDGIYAGGGGFARPAAGQFNEPLPNATPTPFNGPTPSPRPKPTPNPCLRNPRLCEAPIRTPTPAPTRTPH